MASGTRSTVIGPRSSSVKMSSASGLMDGGQHGASTLHGLDENSMNNSESHPLLENGSGITASQIQGDDTSSDDGGSSVNQVSRRSRGVTGSDEENRIRNRRSGRISGFVTTKSKRKSPKKPKKSCRRKCCERLPIV